MFLCLPASRPQTCISQPALAIILPIFHFTPGVSAHLQFFPPANACLGFDFPGNSCVASLCPKKSILFKTAARNSPNEFSILFLLTDQKQHFDSGKVVDLHLFQVVFHPLAFRRPTRQLPPQTNSRLALLSSNIAFFFSLERPNPALFTLNNLPDTHPLKKVLSTVVR